MQEITEIRSTLLRNGHEVLAIDNYSYQEVEAYYKSIKISEQKKLLDMAYATGNLEHKNYIKELKKLDTL